MTRPDDDFERMMRGALGAEAETMEAMFSGTLVEPLYPGRNELLEHFEALEAQLYRAKTDEQREHYLAKFMTALAKIEELDPNMDMQLNGVRSYIVGNRPEEMTYGLFEGTAAVTGKFVGFTVDHWYDIHEGQEMPADDDFTYHEVYGLYRCLDDATLVTDDMEVDCTGLLTQIPLQHGSPELYRLYLAQ